MPRTAKALSLGVSNSPSPISSTLTSPTDPGSMPSSPRGDADASHPHPHIRLGSDDHLNTSSFSAYQDQPTSPDFTSLPPFPNSPRGATQASKEPSKGLFSNLKASKSSNKVHTTSETTIRQVSEEISRSRLDLSDSSVYSRPSPGSTPDLSLSNFETASTDRPDLAGPTASDLKIPPHPAVVPLAFDGSRNNNKAEQLPSKKPKPRFGNLIGRTRSIRVDDLAKAGDRHHDRGSGRKLRPFSPIVTTNTPQIHLQFDGSNELQQPHTPLTPLTAPLPADRLPRVEGGPAPRNRSAERGSTTQSSLSGSFKDGPGSILFNGIQHTKSKAADGINKVGKTLMGKANRSGSSQGHREEERYVPQMINLPLVEQTRRSRIAARLENSKDKTEFWMPALPWRCIDYLNFRGCEEEGLYRVPGSDREIRAWQKRFDQEGDINLFDEDSLYDINTIGSLFKAWLRELPTEIFPKATQTMIYQAHPDATEVPKLLKDQLSCLPPWNYYLLFAITCHLSLLTAYADKNKMTYSNLVICFQPCLKIDNYCFQFLVQKWRDCWQGCWTEKEALEEEYRILDGLPPVVRDPPTSSDGSSGGSGAVVIDDRPRGATKLSGKHRMTASSTRSQHQSHRPPPLTISTGNQVLTSSSSNQNGHARSQSQLPELAPVKPLSPIGL